MGWIRWSVAVALGLALGLGSVVVALRSVGATAIEVAGWRTPTLAGSADADPWTRAAVAMFGLLALPRAQAVYFERARDDAGDRLDPSCRYRLTGGPLPADWWSITLYAGDQYLARNDDAAHSIDATRAGSGAWEAEVGPVRPKAGLWISTRGARDFLLMTRLYGAHDLDPKALAALPPPTLVKLDCGQGAL